MGEALGWRDWRQRGPGTDNGDRPDNGGEGRLKERFGSGREVEELEVGLKEGRKKTATKEVER